MKHSFNSVKQLLLLLFLTTSFLYSQTSPDTDHSLWDELLQRNVDEQGWVNYPGFVADSTKLDAYLTELRTHPPTPNSTRNQQLAYYINAYNAYTVYLILQHYPVKSIKDIKAPWKQPIAELGSETLSLNDIEHKVLRKMDEPRIHFAINCASVSCPKLLNRAFLAETLDDQLAEVTRDFLMSDKNMIRQDSLELSSIFKWFGKDFTVNGKKDILGFIQPYTDVSIDPKARIVYLEYDWNLNEQK